MKPRVTVAIPWSLSTPPLTADVRWELRHQLTALSALAQWAMVPVILLTVSGLWLEMDQIVLRGWGMLAFVQTLLGVLNNRVNSKRLQQQNSPDDFMLRNSLYYAMAGMVWGLLPLGAALIGTERASWFALLINMAIMTSLVLILSTSHRIFYFALATSGLLTLTAVFMGPANSPQIVLLGLIYVLALIMMHNTVFQLHVDRVRTALSNAAHASALANTLEHHDAMTGLYNKAGLHQWLGRHVCPDANYKTVTLALGNVKGFSDINLLHGSSVADALLVEIATRLIQKAGEGIGIARLNGAEFLLIDARPEADAGVLAQMLASLEREDFVISDRLVNISIQQSSVNGKAEDLDNLVETARAQLQPQRPDAGLGDNYRENYRDSSDNQKLHNRRELVTGFHAALMNKDIQPWFQPIVSCSNNRIIGWEALARWRHPAQGLIAPENFLDIARISGHATQLTRMMFVAGVEFIGMLNKAALESSAQVSINFTASDLASATTLDWVQECLNEYGLQPTQLCIEISEKEALLQDAQLNENLRRIEELGILLAIDDFGTGYANLSHLLDLPAATVKLDKRFIDKLPHDIPSVALVRAIITMATSMNMRTVAEGVEREEQLEFLRENGCSAYQGYLAGPALPTRDAIELAQGW